MSSTFASLFPRTQAALDSESNRGWWLAVGAAFVLAIAWTLWMVLARVPVLAVSEVARLEVEGAAQPVESAVSGRLVSASARLGSVVREGDVLFELDSESATLQLAEEKARSTASSHERAAMTEQLAAREAALAKLREASVAAGREGEARREEAESALRLAAQEERRMRQLHAGGQISEAALASAIAGLEQRRAAFESLGLGVARLKSEREREEQDLRARLAELRQARARLEGQFEQATAAIARLQHDIEQRRIRAPRAGQVAEIAGLGVGAFIQEGQRLAAIVPSGELKAVAELPPGVALGRVQPGQRAWLRLEGFPSSQFGSVRSSVLSVATEPRSGRVRVELSVSPDPALRLPLRHGLPGTVEIEVERVSPATLLWRAVGQRIDAPVRPPEPSTR